MVNMIARLGLLIWAREKAQERAVAVGPSEEGSPLSASCGAALRQQQNANLVSRIYQLSGNGTLPLSGGKFELGKRSKQFDEG